MATEVSSDDKLLAALSYWGSFVLWFIPALVIYFMKKDQSIFIKKHALQALMLNIVFVLISIVFTVLGMILGAITLGIGSLLIMLVHVVVSIALAVYLVILGVQVFQGNDPEIPVLSDMIQKNFG